jgi:cell division protein FtsB
VKNQTEPTPSLSYRSFLGTAVVFLMLLLATAGYRSWRDLASSRAHANELRGKITNTGERIEHLRDLIERVENDPLTLERLARENLGLVRPGDVVIVLPKIPTAQP